MLDYNQHMRTRMAYHAASDAIPGGARQRNHQRRVAPTGGIFGGEVPVMNLDGWTFEEATVKPNAGITFNFPALGGGGGRGGGAAADAAAAPRPATAPTTTCDANAIAGWRRSTVCSTRRAPTPSWVRTGTTNWEMEALVPVVEGQLPLIVNVSRDQDIRDAVAWAEKARVKIVISGGTEANLVAPLLKEKNIPVILGNILSGPSRPDGFHASTYQLAGELAKAGVKFAFSSGDNTNVRLLPTRQRCRWPGASIATPRSAR